MEKIKYEMEEHDVDPVPNPWYTDKCEYRIVKVLVGGPNCKSCQYNRGVGHHKQIVKCKYKEENMTNKTYSVGDKFVRKYDGSKYQLISIRGTNLQRGLVQINSLQTGTPWWGECVQVDNIYNITKKEIEKIFDGDFHKFERREFEIKEVENE